MTAATIIGALATVASTVSFSPQAWKVIRTRRTDDISGRMYIITVIGFALWTSYGVMLMAWPLIVSNVICFLLSGFILMMKLVPRREKDAIADTLEPHHRPGPRR